MTTPDTSAVRAWARSNGFAVAERGRLPAEVTDAYLAAHPGGRKAAAKPAARPATKSAVKTAVKTAPKPKPAAKTAPKPVAKRTAAKKATSRKTVTVVAAPADATPAAAPVVETPAAPTPAATTAQADPTPRPKPSVVEDDRRLVALGEQVSALADRVTALEAAAGKANGKASFFRRSR